MSYCNAEGAPRKPGFTESQKLHLRVAEKFAFYAVRREDVRTLGLDWFDDNSRWLATGEVNSFSSFVSLAGPRVLRSPCCFGEADGPRWAIETAWPIRLDYSIAFHVAVVPRSLFVSSLAQRLPDRLAIKWLNEYRQVSTSPVPCESFKDRREFWDDIWQPELISLLGPEVLPGGAR